jgi:drug/metabolite transporter (DMT)-like permease
VETTKPLTLRGVALTAVAMLAFAGNSLLCRLALGRGEIDPASFTTIRIASGALMLLAIVLARHRRGVTRSHSGGGWRAAVMLLGYAALFSFAYRSLGAGTGALILFGAVQLTMFGAALRSGERFPLFAWGGLALAIGGLVWLVLPGVTAPDPKGAALMAAAGVCWGFYSLAGRGGTDPLGATTRNFLYALPAALIVSLIGLRDIGISANGALLAVASGAITSGCGYVIWYAALRNLSATQAAIVQLTVPIIAAFGGVMFLGEGLSTRLLLASVLTLGGVAIVLMLRGRKPA